MKYMVLVNRKFMVAVENEGSALSAEHYILDNFQGIIGAQAFDRAALKTDYFADVLQDAESISLDELKKMSDRYEEAYVELSNRMDDERKVVDEIERLKALIEQKEAELSPLHHATMKAKLDARNAKLAMNCIER